VIACDWARSTPGGRRDTGARPRGSAASSSGGRPVALLLAVYTESSARAALMRGRGAIGLSRAPG